LAPETSSASIAPPNRLIWKRSIKSRESGILDADVSRSSTHDLAKFERETFQNGPGDRSATSFVALQALLFQREHAQPALNQEDGASCATSFATCDDDVKVGSPRHDPDRLYPMNVSSL
jgi:hypothetical protein